jgi:hypothetical protein
MTEKSVEDFLGAKMGTVPKPPVLPAGTYLGTITKHEFVDKKFGAEVTKALRINIKVAQAEADVEEELLAAIDMSRQYVQRDYALDANGHRAFDRLCVTLFGENAEGAGLGEYLPLLVGKSVVFKVTNTRGSKPGDDGEFPIFVNVQELKGLPQE